MAAKSTESTPNLPGSIYTVAQEVYVSTSGLTQQVTDLGSEGVPFKCDVRDDAEIEKMVEETIRRFGRIDILINNAGALWWKKVVDTDMKRYDLINGINSSTKRQELFWTYIHRSHICLHQGMPSSHVETRFWKNCRDVSSYQLGCNVR